MLYLKIVTIMFFCVLLNGCQPPAVDDSERIVVLEQYQLIYKPAEQKPETLLTISIKDEGIQSVRGEIVGLDMSMGTVPLFFSQSEDGAFVAQFLLGMCTDPKMYWQVKLLVTDKAGSTKELKDKFQLKI